ESGADADNLVGGNGCADAATTDEDPARDLAVHDGATDRRGKVGIVHGCGGMRAKVEQVVAVRTEHSSDGLFQLEAGVICADRQSHRWSVSILAKLNLRHFRRRTRIA